MKLQLLSDLHLEGQPHWTPSYAPGADALVLAGDIGSYQKGSRLQDADFGLARFSPLQAWPVPVFFIPGNHEYDGLDFHAAHARLRASCALLCSMLMRRFLSEEAIQVAIITESIHAATLLHDDIIDQAAQRRGHPAANVSL